MTVFFLSFRLIQIFDNFEVTYLSLPESYDANFNFPLKNIISSLRALKK